MERCHPKTCRIYTKTFGGKILENLHSVSPDNFFDDNNFKGVPPCIFFPPKKGNAYQIEHKLAKNFESNHLFFPINEDFVSKMAYNMIHVIPAVKRQVARNILMIRDEKSKLKFLPLQRFYRRWKHIEIFKKMFIFGNFQQENSHNYSDSEM